MDAELATLILQVRLGSVDAYEAIVQRFQDMAVGYSLARLGDLHLAEDAAQEAFLTAYIALPTLHEPAAFPGWFRRILIKHIDRIHRTRRANIPLDRLADVAAAGSDPADLLEHQELQTALHSALQRLPAGQREAVVLFYMGAYSHADISAFLSIPVSTVKMRLYHARQRLAKHLVTRIEEFLPSQRPSRSSTFREHVMSYPVQTKSVPAQPVLSVTREAFISDLQAHLDGSITTLTVYARTQGVQITGVPLAIYHGAVREDRHARVEICLPVGAMPPATIEIAVKELPAAQVAYTVTTVRQSIFPGVLQAYAAIEAWMAAHGHTAADHPRELYLNVTSSIFSPTASLDDPCVEIAWPFQ